LPPTSAGAWSRGTSASVSGTASTRASGQLIDDHALLRTGGANIINQEVDLHVGAEAGNAE
jgi:hypothetical protein